MKLILCRLCITGRNQGIKCAKSLRKRTRQKIRKISTPHLLQWGPRFSPKLSLWLPSQYSVFVQADGRQPGVAHQKPTLSRRRRSRAALGTRNPPPSGAPSPAPSSIQPPERLRSRPPSPANRGKEGRAMRAAAIPASQSGTSDGRRWAGRRRELWRVAAAVRS